MIKTKFLRPVTTLALVLTLGFVLAPTSVRAAAPDDHVALAGSSSGKIFFDVNVAEGEKLSLYLQVINETRVALVRQQVRPEIVVAFRGPAVKLVAKSAPSIAAQIRELQSQGVRFEACAVATKLFGVNNAEILPEVTVVGNTFISSLGYQNQGYALIPIL